MTQTRTASEAAVQLRHANLGYERRPVVRDVSLRIDQGERVALLGPNGSGKSTLVRGILGLAELLGGSLELFGTRLDRFTDRARIGYIPQRNLAAQPVPSTVWEVVRSGRLARRQLLRPMTAADRQACEHALVTVGLDDRRRAQVGQLSGGQQRRVLIARALAAEPDLLIMDEPTAGVDVGQQEALLGSLHRLAQSEVTMLVVTHELAGLAGLLDRALIMRNGRLASDAPMSAVVPGGRL